MRVLIRQQSFMAPVMKNFERLFKSEKHRKEGVGGIQNVCRGRGHPLKYFNSASEGLPFTDSENEKTVILNEN